MVNSWFVMARLCYIMRRNATCIFTAGELSDTHPLAIPRPDTGHEAQARLNVRPTHSPFYSRYGCSVDIELNSQIFALAMIKLLSYVNYVFSREFAISRQFPANFGPMNKFVRFILFSSSPPKVQRVYAA